MRVGTAACSDSGVYRAHVSDFQLYRDAVHDFGHMVGGGAELRGDAGEVPEKAIRLFSVIDAVAIELIRDDDDDTGLLPEFKQRGHDFVGMPRCPVDFIGIQIREILEEKDGVFKSLCAELRDVRRALDRRVALVFAALLVLRDARSSVGIPRCRVHRRDVVQRAGELRMQPLRELLRIF